MLSSDAMFIIGCRGQFKPRRFVLLPLLLIASWPVMVRAQVDTGLIKKIEILGGTVELNEELPDRPVVGVSFEGSQRFNDKYVHLLQAFTRLTVLSLNGTSVTDESLSVIAELPSLQELDVSETQVTDAGLAELKRLAPRLQFFEQPSVIRMLKEYGGLLHMEGRRVTGVTISGRADFGDQQVQRLKPLKWIDFLQFQNTQVTEAGENELRKSAPNLRIIR